MYKRDLRLPAQRSGLQLFSAASKTILVEVVGSSLFFFIKFANGTAFRDEFLILGMRSAPPSLLLKSSFFSDFQGFNLYWTTNVRILRDDVVVLPAVSLTQITDGKYKIRFPLRHKSGKIATCDFILEFGTPQSPQGVKFSLEVAGMELPSGGASGSPEMGIAFQLTVKAPVANIGNAEGFSCDVLSAATFSTSKFGCKSPFLGFDCSIARGIETFFLAAIETKVLAINFTLPFIYSIPNGTTYLEPLLPSWYFVPYGKIENFTPLYSSQPRVVTAEPSHQGMSFTFELRGIAAESFYLDPTVDMRFLFISDSVPAEQASADAVNVGAIAGGCIAAVTVVGLVILVLSVPKLRNAVLPFLNKRKEDSTMAMARDNDLGEEEVHEDRTNQKRWQPGTRPEK